MNEQTEKTVEQVDSNWHHKLVESLNHCKPYARPHSKLLGCFGMILLVVVSVILVQIFAVSAGDTLLKIPLVFTFIGVYSLRIFVFGPVIHYLSKINQGAMSNSALKVVLNDFQRRPIVYLRSFSIDAQLNKLSWYEYLNAGLLFVQTPEQKLVRQLWSQGPVIAIGKPNETLPEVGAARFYAPDDLWQEKIADAIEASQAVVWMTGLSDGLEWEIQHLTSNIPHSKLIVFCHPHVIGSSAEERERQWADFRNKMENYFPKPFPENLGNAQFFVFDSEWDPIPIGGRSRIVALKRAFAASKEIRQDNTLHVSMDTRELETPNSGLVFTAFRGAAFAAIPAYLVVNVGAFFASGSPDIYWPGVAIATWWFYGLAGAILGIACRDNRGPLKIAIACGAVFWLLHIILHSLVVRMDSNLDIKFGAIVAVAAVFSVPMGVVTGVVGRCGFGRLKRLKGSA